METIIIAFKGYILKAFGLQTSPLPWKGESNFPIFLKNYYSFYTVSILEKTYLLTVAKEPEEVSPAQIAKHVLFIEETTGMPCIYVSTEIPAYNRQRLFFHRLRFVIPEVQIYLPDLGIDYRKHSSSKHSSASSELIPSAQAVIIHILLRKDQVDCDTPSELALGLNYTRMTMTRAFNELEKRNIGQILRKGKKRCIRFPLNKEILWEQAQPFLRSPVKEVFWLQAESETFKKISNLGYRAGLTALAEQSMLVSPPCPIFALSQEDWKSLLTSDTIQTLPISEGANIQLEIWSYDPKLFAQDQIVDPFSLYLSLKETEDERVQQALDILMEKIKW